MTLVMCPNILSGANFKEENDVFTANMEKMFHPDYEKVMPVSRSYETSTDMMDERSMNSLRSFRSHRTNKSDSPRDDQTYVLEELS